MADTTSTAVAIATPDLEIIGGQITTTSQQIAEHFGKRHADVIRAIRKLEVAAEFAERNFALSEFTDSTGRTLPTYRITRDGFTLLAMASQAKRRCNGSWPTSHGLQQDGSAVAGQRPNPSAATLLPRCWMDCPR